MSDPSSQLLTTLQTIDPSFLLVVTGAGVSVASGIPTFRGKDPGAIWSRDVTEMATRGFFRANPVESWRWYLMRFGKILEAEPNPAHHALVELERWQKQRGQDFLLVTQNIDDLHDRAGQQNLIHVHGSVTKIRCSRDGCTLGSPGGSVSRPDAVLLAFEANPTEAQLPRCERCDSVMRPHVLWFDEYYQEHEDYGFDQVVAAADRASMALFIGTSFSVGVTDYLVRAVAGRGKPVLAIEPASPVGGYDDVITFVRGDAEVVLPKVVRGLQPPDAF